MQAQRKLFFASRGDPEFGERIRRMITEPYVVLDLPSSPEPIVCVYAFADIEALSSTTTRPRDLIDDLWGGSGKSFILMVVPNGHKPEWGLQGTNICEEREFLRQLDALYSAYLQWKQDSLDSDNADQASADADRGDFVGESSSSTVAQHPEREIEISFDPSLTAEQVLLTLTAIADFYRSCGGIGLSAEFENQECVLEEVHA